MKYKNSRSSNTDNRKGISGSHGTNGIIISDLLSFQRQPTNIDIHIEEPHSITPYYNNNPLNPSPLTFISPRSPIYRSSGISAEIMGRGVSFGGGQSSLGYLFGTGEAPPPKPVNNETEAPKSEAPKREAPKSEVASPVASTKHTTDSPGASVGGIGDIPAGVQSHKNNYLRPEGQNCGNFITDRPSTKVHAEPGGGSSLGYLFGAPKN